MMPRERYRFTLILIVIAIGFPGLRNPSGFDHAAIACGQEWAQKMFAERVHDFGVVAQGTDPVYRFEFQNIYEEDLHIASVRSSCGCTSVSIENPALKTWEKGAIVAQFNTRSFRDRKQATLSVRIDKPFPAEVQLIVRGFIRTDVQFSPGAIEFGEIPEHSKSRQVIKVMRHGNTNWKIVDVQTMFDAEQIRVKLDEVSRGNGVVNYDMTVELQEEVPVGYVQGELFVVTNEGNLRYPVSFSGHVVPALQVSPEVLMISASPGETVQKKVFLKANAPFRITSIESSDASLVAEADGEPKRLQEIRVSYTAGAEAGRKELSVKVNTDIGPASSATFQTIATTEDN